eukprot:UN30832
MFETKVEWVSLTKKVHDPTIATEKDLERFFQLLHQNSLHANGLRSKGTKVRFLSSRNSHALQDKLELYLSSLTLHLDIFKPGSLIAGGNKKINIRNIHLVEGIQTMMDRVQTWWNRNHRKNKN